MRCKKEAVQIKNQFYELGAKYGFGWHENHSKQVIKLSKQLYDQITTLSVLPKTDRDTQVIEDSGFVHDIGRSARAIGAGEHNERSLATLQKELGATACAKEDTQLILYCVHHHTGDLWKKASADNEVSGNLIAHAKRLCAIFRIADALDHSLQGRVDKVSLTLDGLKLTCKIFPKSAEARRGIEGDEKKQAEKKSDLMKKAYALTEVSFELAEG
jgi:HD superfamily phosphodiesterase